MSRSPKAANVEHKQVPLTQLTVEVARSHAAFDAWRQQACAEMQALQLGIDSVISALQRDMQCRYSEMNK